MSGRVRAAADARRAGGRDRPGAPTLRVDLASAAPGWVVRLLPAAALALTTVASGGGTVVWLVAAAVGVLVTWRPDWPWAGAVPALVGTWVLSRDDLLAQGASGALRLAALVVGAHLVVRLGGLAAHVAWRARVELGVLRRSLLPVVVVQAAVLVLVAVVAAVRAGAGTADAGAGWLRAVALVAAVTLVVVLVPRHWLSWGRR
ncbi:hypothetical protein Q9R32_01060 [Actinotalea sp. AC32]|nr:hypothetical protein [Actinotalea sp. AC32]